MLDIVKISEQLFAKLQQEADVLMSDRLLSQQVLEARTRELTNKKNEELNRIEQWAAQQKALISEIFSALIAEVEADRQRNESNLMRMRGELSERILNESTQARGKAAADGSTPRVVARNEQFLKAAQ
jgi:hypothetical protein